MRNGQTPKLLDQEETWPAGRVCEAGQRRAESDEFVGTAVTPRWEHQLCDAGRGQDDLAAGLLRCLPEAVWRVSISLYRPLRDVDRFKVLIYSADHDLFFRHRSFLPDPTPKSFGLIKTQYKLHEQSDWQSFQARFRIGMTTRNSSSGNSSTFVSRDEKNSPRESPRTFAG
jgi:hypothetical protein